MKNRYTLEDVQLDVSKMITRDLVPHNTEEQLSIMAFAGLAEEAGEVAGILKRRIRDQRLRADKMRSNQEALISEIGDTLWYLAMLCACEHITLDEVWKSTLIKLEDRYGK